MLVVERGIIVSSGIVTFLSRKEFTFSGEDNNILFKLLPPLHFQLQPRRPQLPLQRIESKQREHGAKHAG